MVGFLAPNEAKGLGWVTGTGHPSSAQLSCLAVQGVGGSDGVPKPTVTGGGP